MSGQRCDSPESSALGAQRWELTAGSPALVINNQPTAFEYNHIMVSLLDYLFKFYSIHISNIDLHLRTTVDSQNRFKARTLGHVATGRYG